MLDFETILRIRGRCDEAERGHLAGIVAWTIWLMGVEGLDSRPWMPGSLLTLFHYLRQATRWMIMQGYGRWDQLGEMEVIRLKKYMYHPVLSAAPVGPDARRYAMIALRCLYTYHRLWVRMPDGLIVDPAVDDHAVIRAVHQKHRKNAPDFVDGVVRGTRSIPWPLAQNLLAAAIEMVESPHVSTIIELDRVMREFVRTAPEGEDQGKRHRRAVSLLQQMSDTHPDVSALLATYPVNGTRDVYQLQRDLVTAGYIVLAIFGALRISEAAGLPCSGLIDDRPDGPWMTTIILKTSPEDEGSRVPRIVPPVARTAVQVLVAATAADRGNRQELLLSHDHDRHRTSLFTDKVAATRLNDFAARRLGPTAADWQFASHQLRKLFVQIYVRRFNGSLDAVQQHLGHTQARMIEAYLHDPDIMRMIRDEQRDLAVEVMASVMVGGSQASGFAVRAWRDQAAVYRARNMTPKEIADEARRAVDREDLHLESTAIGYCLSSASSGAQAACGRTEGGTPDYANQVDSMCLCCPNNICVAGSKSSLKAEYVLHRQVSESPDAADAMREASQRRCSIIMQRLDDLEAQSAHTTCEAEGMQ